MKYKIIEKRSTNELAESVNEAISEGWIPQGSVVYAARKDGCRWIQAMISTEA